MSSEFELIRRYFAKPANKAVLGTGDDCALLRPAPGVDFAVSTDMLLEGSHFLPGTDPQKLGRKALAVNLSDLAACGADPVYALLAVALPQPDETWIEAFARGFFSLADAHDVELVGGDTTRGPLCVCITVIGEVPGKLALRRSGAKVGDDVWLSGRTGEAALALAHLQHRTRLPESDLADCLDRLDNPAPRVELGGRLRGLASSAIDVSDGLLADLGHVAQASGARIEVQLGRLPRAGALQSCADKAVALQCLVAGGDDYELAFGASVSRRGDILALSEELDVPLTRIGTVVNGQGVALLDENGEPLDVERRGFDHFR